MHLLTRGEEEYANRATNLAETLDGEDSVKAPGGSSAAGEPVICR